RLLLEDAIELGLAVGEGLFGLLLHLREQALRLGQLLAQGGGLAGQRVRGRRGRLAVPARRRFRGAVVGGRQREVGGQAGDAGVGAVARVGIGGQGSGHGSWASRVGLL